MTGNRAETERVVELVVAEVLRRLEQKPGTTDSTAAAADIDHHVVSLQTLRVVSAASRSVTIRDDAVVTPAAADELKRRGIDVQRVATSQQASTVDGGACVVVTAVREQVSPSIARQVARSASTHSALWSCDLEQAVTRAVEMVSDTGRAVVLLCNAPALALCQANRYHHVRAIGSSGVEQTVVDADAVGANLLIVNPARLGGFVLHQVVHQFAAGCPRPCPDVFQRAAGRG